MSFSKVSVTLEDCPMIFEDYEVYSKQIAWRR
jgi:hypothetical protein